MSAKILPLPTRFPAGPSLGPAEIVNFDDYLPIWTLVWLVCHQCLTQWTAATLHTDPEVIKQIACPVCEARGWTQMLVRSLENQTLLYLKWLEQVAQKDPAFTLDECEGCGGPLEPETA